MRMRLGVLISGFITLIIAFSLLYASMTLLHELPFSYLGVIVSITLMALSVATILGRGIAMKILSVFYFILALFGILLAFSLPPEGLLIFLPSSATATYLWRYSRAREGGSSIDSNVESEGNTSPNYPSEEILSD